MVIAGGHTDPQQIPGRVKTPIQVPSDDITPLRPEVATWAASGRDFTPVMVTRPDTVEMTTLEGRACLLLLESHSSAGLCQPTVNPLPHALPGTLLTQPTVPPSIILFLPSLVSCLAHIGELCQALTPDQLAYLPSPWEVFLCSIQDGLVMPDRLPLTPTLNSPFHCGRCIFTCGNYVSLWVPMPRMEQLYTKSRCVVYVCLNA